jgi:two-component system chemotaxis response regulator CheY
MQTITSKRMLLVEHDTQKRLTIARMLQERNAVVVHARDAISALVEYERQPFDVVLTDYDLPDVNGDELAETIKSSNPNQRVILFTGDIEQVLVGGRASVSADVVLSKPCSRAQLSLALRDLAPAPLLPAAQSLWTPTNN